MLNRPLNRMTVGSQTHAVSVARSYVSGTSSSFYVHSFRSLFSCLRIS